MSARPRRVLLAGGGHAHIEVLRRFGLRPDPAIALTLVSPEPAMWYSGMLPGLVAGHYTAAEANVALPPLAQRAGARFIPDYVASLDLRQRIAGLASGEHEPFDVVSLDVGSAPDMRVPGAREFALPVKPVSALLAAWTTLMAEVAEGRAHTIAVVGGGAGGVELLLAMEYRVRATAPGTAPRFALVTDRAALLPDHPPVVGARLARMLVERGVVLHLGSAAVAVEEGAIVASGRRRIAADRIVWATSAASAPWLAASGLACDAGGFVQVDAHLRSTSHPFVFAAGDCAALVARPVPKSGVFAVRQGPALAANLRRAAHGVALTRYRPQRHALALVSTGDRHAIASRGPFVVEGDFAWRWKDRIDRAFVAKYALAPHAEHISS